jgi:hypothetical protein
MRLIFEWDVGADIKASKLRVLSPFGRAEMVVCNVRSLFEAVLRNMESCILPTLLVYHRVPSHRYAVASSAVISQLQPAVVIVGLDIRLRFSSIHLSAMFLAMAY